MSRTKLRFLLTLSLAIALCGTLGAGRTLKMNLADLSQRADKIFRGTIVDVSYDTVFLAGATLRTARYRVQVEEPLKGSFDGSGFVELQMLAPQKLEPSTASSPYQRMGLDLGLPELQLHQEYVLFTSRPSGVGLSTTIGLGQGCFSLEHGDKTSMVKNEIGNAGLLDGIRQGASGPLEYQDFTNLIREYSR